ncbi:response regulator [Chrysiogenes arsenatis]|uniref:response regulator n=1 Tax=Chrysiogenes arsenatis TaxID=309797 RepID=UPI000407BAD2|nr:response regulator [Chrysiogenes arsenatis]
MNANFTVRVLLVEDEPGDAGLIRQALKNSPVGHFDIEWVTSLAEAEAVLAHHRPDVILLDLSLPDSFGLPTVQHLRALSLATMIPIIVLTGNDNESFALEALEVGAQDYLVKGTFSNDSLIRAIYYAKTRAQLEKKLVDFNATLAKQVEQEIRERNLASATYKNLFDAVPDAIIIHRFDAQGNSTFITEMNQSACQMFGYTPEEMMQLTPADLGLCSQSTGNNRASCTARAVPRDAEMELTRADGSKFLAEYTCYCQPRLPGAPAFAVVRDVTEKKRMEHERKLSQQMLIQQSKMAELGTMIGAIAHQWRQPLNIINLLVADLPEMYAYGEIEPEELTGISETVAEQVRFMSQTIEDFRNFYKPSLEPQNFDMEMAVREVLSMLSKQFVLDNIQVDIEVTLTPPLPAIGYRNEFKQVVLNLLNNARDAFIERKIAYRRIVITFNQHSEKVAQVCFQDTAGGIAEELLPDKLFEPFTSTKGEGGTGIGLSLARMIMGKMHGNIEGANSGRGAKFCLSLPARNA